MLFAQNTQLIVMPGLVPGIRLSGCGKQDVDGRDKRVMVVANPRSCTPRLQKSTPRLLSRKHHLRGICCVLMFTDL
jgi:hypothetical protein